MENTQVQSFLSGLEEMQRAYYNRGAKEDYTVSRNGVVNWYETSDKIGRLVYILSRDNFGYAQQVLSKLSLPEDREVDVLEVGSGEGYFAEKFMRLATQKNPNIHYHSVDFSRGNLSLQKLVLKEFIGQGNVSLYNSDITGACLADNVFDVAILNEVFDDLRATMVRGSDAGLEALGFEYTNGGVGFRRFFMPIEDCPDRAEIEGYIERHNLVIGEEPTTIYLGIEAAFGELGRMLKPGSKLWIMDYMANFPGFGSRGGELHVDDHKFRACNITSVIDYQSLTRFAQSNGFRELERSHFNTSDTYNYFTILYQLEK